MHQITSGEIPKKTKVLNRKIVDNFIENEKNIFNKIESNCLYETGEVINNKVLSYLNTKPDNSDHQIIKNILLNEHYQLEKIYPFLGDFLISEFFNDKSLLTKNKIKAFKLNKFHSSRLVKDLKYDINKEICKQFFQNCSLEYLVSVKFSKSKEVIFEKTKENIFNLEFDYDFYKDRRVNKIFNYKIVIIDGVIQHVSEVHHLLHDSAENKSKYAIFCYGMSEEVKQTIINNNKRQITNIFPICLNFDEKSLNVLNDIAVLHGVDVISSNKGQTISTEIRKLKTIGDKLKIKNNSFSFLPVGSEKSINAHKNFLNKKIKGSMVGDVKDILTERYKRLFGKKIIILLPDQLKKDLLFIKELDYVLRCFSNQNKFFITKKISENQKKIYFPLQYVRLVKNKKESLNKTFQNLEKIIVQSKKRPL
jgi:hypothetical protein